MHHQTKAYDLLDQGTTAACTAARHQVQHGRAWMLSCLPQNMFIVKDNMVENVTGCCDELYSIYLSEDPLHVCQVCSADCCVFLSPQPHISEV